MTDDEWGGHGWHYNNADGTRQRYRYRTFCKRCKKPTVPITERDDRGRKSLREGCADCDPVKLKAGTFYPKIYDTELYGEIEKAPDTIKGISLECEDKVNVLQWHKKGKK